MDVIIDGVRYVPMGSTSCSARPDEPEGAPEQENTVRVRVEVDKEAALKEGKSGSGLFVVSVPVAALSYLQREELARWGTAERKSPEADFYLDGFGFYDGPQRPPTAEATVHAVTGLLDRLVAWRGRETEQMSEMTRWISESGSQRLRSCLAAGIECIPAYRDERLRAERTDWRWYVWCSDSAFWSAESEYEDHDLEVYGWLDTAVCPNEEALALLSRARQGDENARLMRWYTDMHESYAAVSDWLGRPVIYMAEYPEP